MLLAAGLFFLAGAMWLVAVNWLPLDDAAYGYDWRNYYWLALHRGWPSYQVQEGLFIPPWIMLLIWPLGALPFKASWAALTFLALGGLIWCLPRRPDGRLDAGLILVIICSHWMLRYFVDGNLDILVMAGYALLLAGWQTASPGRLAAGALLAMAKYQASWLTLIVLAVFVLKTWPVALWRRAVLLALAGALPGLFLFGADWVNTLFPPADEGRTSILTDVSPLGPTISLRQLETMAGLPVWAPLLTWLVVLGLTLWIIARLRWRYSTPLAGLLLTASLLLSPYAGGLSLATVLVVAVAPMLRSAPLPGAGLLAVAYGPHLTRALCLPFEWPILFQTLLLFGVWLTLGWHCLGQTSTLATPDPIGAL